MLLVALFHIALIELQIHLSVEQVPGSSLAAANHVHKHEVAIQDDQDQGEVAVLDNTIYQYSQPKIYIIPHD